MVGTAVLTAHGHGLLTAIVLNLGAAIGDPGATIIAGSAELSELGRDR